MILTSIAAALLAAVTGMTTIRAPGGDEQQVEVKPTYAWEMTVADIDNPNAFVRALRYVDRIDMSDVVLGIRPSQMMKLKNKVATTFETVAQGLRRASFSPEKMSYYNVYSVEEVPGKHGAPSVYEQNIEYSVITFFDKDNNEINFLDTCGSEAFDNYKDSPNVISFNSNMGEVDTFGTKFVTDLFIKAGLTDLSYLKTYEETVYDHPMNIDTSVVDMTGSDQSGTMGMYYENWAPWNNWEVIGYILRNRKNRHDVIRPGLVNAVMVNEGAIVNNPLSSVYMNYELEAGDIVQGQNTLCNQIVAGVNAAMSLDYSGMLQLNDLNIVY